MKKYRYLLVSLLAAAFVAMLTMSAVAWNPAPCDPAFPDCFPCMTDCDKGSYDDSSSSDRCDDFSSDDSSFDHKSRDHKSFDDKSRDHRSKDDKSMDHKSKDDKSMDHKSKDDKSMDHQSKDDCRCMTKCKC